MSDEILETKDVAKLFKVHNRTVTRMVEQGKLKAFRVGDLLRFRRSDIDAFINSQLEGEQHKEEAKEAGKQEEEPLPA